MASPPHSRREQRGRPLRSPRYLFSFRGMELPIWVVRVQWRRFCILGKRLNPGIYANKADRWVPAPWIEKRQELRIETFCRQGSLSLAAQELKKSEAGSRVVRNEAKRIRYAILGMLRVMHDKDHRADWVERETIPIRKTERKRGPNGRGSVEVMPPWTRPPRKVPLSPLRRGAA